MFNKRIWKLVILVPVLLALTTWLLTQNADAQQDERVATFVTHITPDLESQTQPAPQVHLEIGESARVGDWVTARLVATEGQNLAGFQVDLRFDGDKLGLGTAQPVMGNAAAAQLLSLGYVRQEQGLLLGVALCPAVDCASAHYQQDRQSAQGMAGTVELASFTFQVRQGGVIHLEVADIILVDPQGQLLLSSQDYPLATVPQPPLTALDLSANNQINDADAYLVVSAWRELQRTGRCLAPAVTAYDVDGNGCLNVADVQTILSVWGEQPMPPYATGRRPGYECHLHR
ncbi:MAG: hypothetical protein IPL78_31415 [Chloroflexi bacterium]|nr:hypothetical protein [Chloroflexota bacterium]